MIDPHHIIVDRRRMSKDQITKLSEWITRYSSKYPKSTKIYAESWHIWVSQKVYDNLQLHIAGAIRHIKSHK